MPYMIRMAFRNIRRNKRRTALAVISVLLSVLLIMYLSGLIGGVMESMVKNYTKNETGHVRITTSGFLSKARFLPVTENIPEPGAVKRLISSDPAISEQVSTVTERISFGVLLSNEGYNKQALALAGEAENEKDLIMLSHSVEPGGRYLAGRGETIVGTKLATALKLEVGDSLKVLTEGADYGLHLKRFTVVGIFKTGLNSLDDALFQIPLEDAQELLVTEGGSQSIMIMLKDFEKAESAAALIQSRLNEAFPESGLVAQSWTEIGDYPQMIEMSFAVFRAIYVVVAALGAFIITNIMMMVVLERRKEIGIMKSMGFSRSRILVLFLAEGSCIGFLGSLAGVALGLLINLYFNVKGVDFSSMIGSFNYPMDNVIRFEVSLVSAFRFLVMGTVVSAFMSLLPSLRASKMSAVDAIKSI